METNQIDKISELPDHIIEDILCRLSTRDAVRTSVLSSKWRLKWTTLPSVVFGDSFMCPHIFESNEEFVSTIDHVLSRHVGPIHKFKLCYDIYAINEHMSIDHEEILLNRDINRWILRLSRSHIKELSLMFYPRQCSMLPSCTLFSQKLTGLELCNSSLKLSETFKGFGNLKSLHISSVTLTKDMIEILIRSSPVLESVALWPVHLGDFVENINVDAPNLRVFKFCGTRTNYITFRNTFCLAEVTILWSKPYQSRHLNTSGMPRFFDNLLNVRRLTLKGGFIECLALGGLPREYPLRNLKYLSTAVNFNRREEILAALCLLRSAPNLQELNICNGAQSLLKNIKYPNFLEADQTNRFTKLQRVEMSGIFGSEGEIYFINFMLSTSTVLETMTIRTILGFSKLSKLKKSLCKKRASLRAEIIIK
ncbi:F-box/FBD/LRR-repeat protein At1g13570 [Morus notabilis]|uniref:F-box/FBD/LRR-repeat protein At1g13570 n=1 Tax=Morus notabilis TaxID=981085 RepID=UPI000CED587A|nr:F-box/FBD/LRR-repeat protein At1g13570 [Morus notabilis]